MKSASKWQALDKKHLFLIAVLVVCGILLYAVSASASSGTCGEGLTWVLDYSGLLTISGNGGMSDFSDTTDRPPWNNSGAWLIYKIVIEQGVTSIGNYAFSNCSNLTDITIPNGVTRIGDSAFSYCSSLTDITIPNNVARIGDSAFYSCSNLTEITIPDSVTSIGDYAFAYCKSLTEIIIPDSITNISDHAFAFCSNLTEITIPDSVTSIGDWTFSVCSNLTEITIPDSVTSIGDYAFYYCDSLTEITIPDSVISIGDYAFNNCRNMTEITIPDSITSIGDWTFSVCSNLTQITIPDSVTSIGDYAFYYCESLTEITIPDSVTSIGSSAFAECSSLSRITIPDSVISIGGSAFSGCSSLTGIICQRDSFAYTWARKYGYNTQSNLFIFDETAGNPVGEPENLRFSTFRDDPDETRGTVHSLTRQNLDNGYVRFVIQYTVPEMLNISVFNPPNGDVFSFFDRILLTDSERSILQFDISEEKLSKVKLFTVGFIDFSTEYWVLGMSFAPRNPERVSHFEINVKGGTPVGAKEKVRFAVLGDPTSSQEYYHSFVRQKLNNGGVRFKLEFSVPDDLYMAFAALRGKTPLLRFGSQETGEITSSGLSTLTFDIGKEEMKAADFIELFFYDDNGNDYARLEVFLNDNFLNGTSCLYLPTSVRRIENEAFAGLSCGAVIIPETCTYIGNGAFRNCSDLWYIRLPENVEINPGAFEECGEMWVDRIPGT